MANPQVEHGHTRIANEILDQIMKLNLNGTQFRIVMAVWRYTYGFQRKEHEMSLNFIAKAIDASRTQVNRELSVLIDRKIIKSDSGPKGVRILSFNKNYDEWEHCTLNRAQYSNSRTEVYSNQSTDVYSNQRTKKENNKENNKKNIYVEIIEYLNKKAGKRFSPKSQANRKLINGRLAEGRTVEDFKYVIDVKCDHWLDDPKMNEYLRPSTLFAQKNFENYLNQKPKNQKTVKTTDIRDKEIEFQRWVAEGNDPDEFDWNI
ncbi:conserved phage C-terminal domain-containing protein [Aeribacillus composti]|uniref:Conserved phage C-terminal domain-containing protein n=1 Tax=Aeribacillus composti TaxID=1868734 RepID=A0ABY9WCE5_9BACI|nr:conserved phage C-terminal domain-containing protein [Aeribacillus composti]WNF33815.1 conserved phage C-terminal domain-containing protein [Aeribacillus composti]